MRTSAFRAGVGGAILPGWRLPRARCSSDACASSGELERALDAARAGGGTTALVAGEAGIGKTRLASELAARARGAGFEVLLGRSIDLVGTELPYQPFVEALRPLGGLPQVDGQAAGSQLRVFQETLALLGERAAAAPVLLVLEDLHWADTSTLDLVVFLAHNLDDRRVLLLATYRADEPASAERMRRLADGVRRSGSALVLELGPLEREELTALLAARAGAPPPAALTDAIVARSEGNPFFAEELLAAAGDQGGELPRGLRDLLLQRVARLDPATQGLLRVAAAAGRDVGYPLLRAVAALPERDLRESLRQAVEHGVLVAEQATGSFRFRHALLAEAVYATHPARRARGAARAARPGARAQRAAAPAELAPHWAAAGRGAEALAASVEAARQAEAVFGLAEALAHLERALALWHAVPDAAELVRLDLAELCSWAAELASQTGAAPRAVELAQRAIELVGDGDPLRAALLHERLGRYLHESGSGDAALAAFERAVELVPAQPPSAGARAGAGGARARADAGLAPRRVARDLRAGARARARGRRARGRAPGAHGARQRPRLPRPRRRGPRAAPAGPASSPRSAAIPMALHRAYVALTDVLTMLGRPRGVGAAGGGGARRHAPVRDRSHRARREPDRGPARDRRVGRGRQRSARRRFAPSPPTTRTCPSCSAPTSSSAAATSTPRGRTSTPRVATLRDGPRPGDLRRLRRRARAVGAPLDGRRGGCARRPGAGALP